MLLRAGIVLLTGLIGSWIAWHPGRDHPDNPVKIRGFFRFINWAGKIYEGVRSRSLFRLDPAEFDQQLTALKTGEQEVYGSLNTPSEFHGLRALFQGLEAPGSLLSPLGKFFTRREVRNRLRHRQRVLDYVRQHPEILKEPVCRPLIIAGFPRSGSTFLQRLMATDPRARSPHLWEMRIDPSPRPPTEAEVANLSDPRIQQLQKAYKSISLISPDYFEVLNKYHETNATNIDEEVQLLRDCMWNNIGGTYVGEDDSYQRWIANEAEDKTYMYRYLRVWLQIMSSTYPPESHWVLKTPSHAYFLPTLAQEFPDANLVFTHRDPRSFVASACKLNLVAMAFRVDFNKLDPQRHGRRVLEFLKVAADLMRRFHHGNSEMSKRALHIQYEELVADPVGVVERIYAHFGYKMTEDFRANMKAHLSHNRQHKHGKPDYSLEHYGLNETKVNEAFAGYNQTFRQRVEV